jgi:hypothetical protein
MARRPALIAKKAKKPRVTQDAAYLVNLKYMGGEPEFKAPLTSGQYGDALNWYNTMCNAKDARQYLQEYLTNQGRKAEAKLLNQVSDTWIPTTIGWVARLLNRGYTLPITAKPYLDQRLKETLARVTKEETKDTNTVSIQERMRERQSEIIADIEEMIDSGAVFSLYDWLKAREIPASYCPAIVAYYAPWLDELLQALEGGERDLKEAYGYLTKKQLKDRVLFFSKLLEDASSYGNVTKKTRAPRKPRTVSVEKKLKALKYQKEDNNYKIASINPEKIIGAQELWTFNTKYKTITVLRALDRGGLQVKGTSITNYDEATSVTKRTGRQPEKHLTSVTTGGKMILKKVLVDLKDAPLAYRINENTILLRVM